jgi:hypothetical protein
MTTAIGVKPPAKRRTQKRETHKYQLHPQAKRASSDHRRPIAYTRVARPSEPEKTDDEEDSANDARGKAGFGWHRIGCILIIERIVLWIEVDERLAYIDVDQGPQRWGAT